MKFDPFNRRTQGLPPPFTFVSCDFNEKTHRYTLVYSVSNTNAGQAALAQNFRAGSPVLASGKALIVAGIVATERDVLASPGQFFVEVEAIDPATLMQLAATGSAEIPKNEAGERVVTAPKKIYTGARRLILT